MAVPFPSSLKAVSRRSALQGVAALAAGGMLSHTLLADAPRESASPEEVLQKRHGLVRLSGNVWGLPLEVELKERLAQLQPLKEGIVTAEKDLEDRAAANRRAWQEAAPALETLKQAITSLSTSDPKRIVLQQQLGAVEATTSEPSRLSCRADIRGKLIALSRDRSLLQLAVLWIRAGVPRLHEQYARLSQVDEVAATIKKLGGDKLGPLKNYAPELKKLAEHERLVFTSWVPVYQQAGQTRLAAIVNEQAPLTFTWSEETGAIPYLPASAVESCGLSVPGEAPQKQIRLAGRSLSIREVVIPALRLGRHVVKDISAWLLPPEGEDLGARLPRVALRDLRANIELDRLRMTLGE